MPARKDHLNSTAFRVGHALPALPALALRFIISYQASNPGSGPGARHKLDHT